MKFPIFNTNYVNINRLIAFTVFIFTLIVYSITVAPTVSLWDCGEFIACSYNLAVTHPPGAPLYLLIGRLFSLIPFADDIAFRVNYISVLSSALTIFFLYLSIVLLIKELVGGFKSNFDWLVAIFSALLGSFTFAFTHSFWFNAAEAEVYAPSTAITSMMVWLNLVWAQKSDQPGNEKILILIFYLLGLSICIHLLNILVLPFIVMIYYFKKYKTSPSSFLIMVLVTIAIFCTIYLGIVKSLPTIFVKYGLPGIFFIVIGMLVLIIWSIRNNRRILNLISVSIFLITLGYSTYTSVLIRSNLNPIIDMNNPETAENFQNYIDRKQYGDHSILDRTKVWKTSTNKRQYESAWDYFLSYQLNRMYLRYFLWQFVGVDENEDDWTLSQFYALPLLLGILGMYWHFKKDYKRAISVLGLFLMTGLILVLYLNQSDPQPRERDYSYVVSFFAFSIWIGLSYQAIINVLKTRQIFRVISILTLLTVFILLIVLVPLQMFVKNYESHNRTGRYIAWDYAYNMLQTCKPNAILFTGGDNDTYPLWYLQEVENIRKDVRVVCLELLNTNWYVQQLRDLEPKVPMYLNDRDIKNLGLIPWKKKKVTLDVSRNVVRSFMDDYNDTFVKNASSIPNKITFEVRPTFKTAYGPVLCVRDSMILRVLQANKWIKPVYFSASASRNSYPLELRRYLRMDGLVLQLVPFKNQDISPQILKKNLHVKYQYRGFQKGNVYYDKTIKAFAQNYRSAFLELISHYARVKELENMRDTLSEMENRVSNSALPWINKHLRLLRDSYRFAGGELILASMLEQNYREEDLLLMGENLLRVNMLNAAQKIYRFVYENNPSNGQALSVLITICEREGKYKDGIRYLERWLDVNPGDNIARKRLELFRRKSL